MSNFSTLDLVDRESLSRRLMTLVRKYDEVHQRGQQRFELVVLLLAHARIEQGFDSADDPGSGKSGLGATLRKQPASLRIEGLGEVVEEFDTAPNSRRAGRPGLDHHRSRRVWFAAGELEQRFEPEADPVAPLLSVAGGGVDGLSQPL